MAIQERPRTSEDAETPGLGLGEAWEQGRREARDLGETISRITSGLRELSGREMELARAEMLDTKDAARSAGVWGGVGAIVALIALEFLALAGMFALAEVMPLWGAALVTAGVLAVIAAIGLVMARSAMKDFNLVPRSTMASVQEDMRWAREHVWRSNG